MTKTFEIESDKYLGPDGESCARVEVTVDLFYSARDGEANFELESLWDLDRNCEIDAEVLSQDDEDRIERRALELCDENLGELMSCFYEDRRDRLEDR